LFDRVNHLIRRRSAGGDADRLDTVQPSRLHLVRALHMDNPGAEAPAGVGQLAGVVALGTADHHDQIALSRQLDRRRLPLLRWLANSVGKPHVRVGKACLDS
jgi:hypothetical protein